MDRTRALAILRRTNVHLVFGICLGITIGLTAIPLLDFGCTSDTAHAQRVTNPSLFYIPRPAERALQLGLDLNSDLSQKENGRVKLNRNKREAATPPLMRPRYISTELGMRQKVLVGVVLSDTSPAGIQRFIRINQTLRHTVDKIIFFANGSFEEANTASQRLRDLGLTNIVPIEVRRGDVVDLDSEELVAQHVSLRALKYFGDKFINNFDYFFICLDKGYISGPNLMKGLKKISIKERTLWGVPRVVPDKTTGSVACQLDFGFAISRQVLMSIGDRLSRCWNSAILRHTHSNNVTKCLEYLAPNLTCRKEIQNQVYKVAEGATLKFRNWTQSVIFAGPISTGQEILEVHGLFCRGRKLKIDEEIRELRDVIISLEPKVPEPWRKLTWPIGLPKPIHPNNRFEVNPWAFFTKDKIYFKDSRTVVKTLEGVDKEDIQNILKVTKGFLENKDPSLESSSHEEGTFQFESGYRRFSPTRGMEYLLDFKQVPNGGHCRVQGLRPLLNSIEIVPVPFTTEAKRPFIIVPITKASVKQIEHFLRYWFSVTSDLKHNHTDLILTLVQNVPGASADNASDLLLSSAEVTKLTQLISMFNNGSHPSLLSVKRPSKVGNVKVAFAVVSLLPTTHIRLGILDFFGKRQLIRDTSLILFLEPNAHLNDEFLNRVKLQTIIRKQVYSPIPFVEYEPGVKSDPLHEPPLTKDEGAFNPAEFRIVSFYYADYLEGRRRLGHTVRQLIRTVDDNEALLEVFLKGTSLNIFRAVDPNLTLRSAIGPITQENCDRDLDRCVNTLWGSASQLAKVVLDSGFSG